MWDLSQGALTCTRHSLAQRQIKPGRAMVDKMITHARCFLTNHKATLSCSSAYVPAVQEGFSLAEILAKTPDVMKSMEAVVIVATSHKEQKQNGFPEALSLNLKS